MKFTEKEYKEKFWEKVKKQSGCFIWLAAKNRKGYGMYGSKKEKFAHRISFLFLNGEIPKGMLVCHTCDNPSCVNPKHLFLGTAKDNALDMVNKARSAFQKGNLVDNSGENHGMAKLKDKFVGKIKKLYESGKTQAFIAKQFNIDQAQISRIINKKSWIHV